MASFVRQLCSDQSGTVAVIAALAMVALVGVGAISVDAAYVFRAQTMLQAATDEAAQAGAMDINCCVGAPGTAINTATTYSAVTGSKNALNNLTVTMASGYPVLKCLTSTGLSCSGPDSANAIEVKQTATVPVFFAKILGVNSVQISATATASARGGGTPPLNVMFILDTTASMNDSDTSCSISHATRLDCALAGIQTILATLRPSVDEVGLMAFPGVTNASQLPYEYDCSNSPAPKIAAYNKSPLYEIIGFSTNYRTSDTATTLNTSSDLVLAVRAGPPDCQEGIDAVGGVGTFYADAITAAQTALAANGKANTQNVIILLSDGDASASSSNMPSGEAKNQCHEAITAAATAAATGTWVYSVAYGSSTSSSSSCSTDSPAISACSTMQQIASDATKFYSDTTGGTSTCTSTVNSVSDLIAIFQDIGNSLTTTRLLPNNTT